MKKRLAMILACCVAGACAVSCNESVEYPSCNEGDKQCSNNAVVVCQNGSFVEEKKCEGATPVCDDATHTCIADKTSSKCANFVASCKDGVLTTCDETNGEGTKNCEDDEQCGTVDDKAACVKKGETGKCANFVASCNAGVLTTCDETNGEGTKNCEDDEECGEVDGKAACVKKGETSKCANFVASCNAGVLTTCDETNGEGTKNCEDDEECGTNDGKAACVKKATTDDCTAGEKKCNDGNTNIMICVNGSFAAADGTNGATACTANEVCVADATLGAKCEAPVASCTADVCANGKLQICTASTLGDPSPCSGIENAKTYGCNTDGNACIATECNDGFRPSADGLSCVSDPDKMDCTDKADGAYCATVEGQVTSYVCASGEVVTDGWLAPLPCESSYPKCREVVGASYPVCGVCSTDDDCAEDESCNDQAECQKKGSVTPEAICAEDTNDDAYCVDSTSYVQCDGGYVDEVWDCSDPLNENYSGSACVDDDWYGASCGCNSDADCTTALFGKACDTELKTCGCNSDADCGEGMECKTSAHICIEKAALTLASFCATASDGATTCNGTVQYYCDSAEGNEEYDCKDDTRYGTACVKNTDGEGYCGCNGTEDCSTSTLGKACLDSVYGVKQCGCNSNSDCGEGMECNTSSHICKEAPSVPTLTEYCSSHSSGSFACFGSLQYYCTRPNRQDDCTGSSKGNICFVNPDTSEDEPDLLCGCNTSDDCTAASNGRACVASNYYIGISQCGCNSDSDCPTSTCNTTLHYCR